MVNYRPSRVFIVRQFRQLPVPQAFQADERPSPTHPLLHT